MKLLYISEHLHILAQEALDHADLPVLTATLGAAALLKNSLYCYVQHVEDAGNSERHSILQVIFIRNIFTKSSTEQCILIHNTTLSIIIVINYSHSCLYWLKLKYNPLL